MSSMIWDFARNMIKNKLIAVSVAAGIIISELSCPLNAFAEEATEDVSEAGSDEEDMTVSEEEPEEEDQVTESECDVPAVIEGGDYDTSTTRYILDSTQGISAGAGTIMSTKSKTEYIQAAEDAEGTSWGFTHLGISNVSDHLNIRALPDESGKLVGKLAGNAACEIMGVEGDWTHIASGSVEGYVKSEYLLTGIKAKQKVREFVTDMVKVGTDGLNVREYPSTDAPIITQVATGELLEYVCTSGDWVGVLLDDETVFVSAEYVEITQELDTALTMTEVLYGEGVSDIRASICNFALQYVGNPYVWGGVSLTRGADCSGFVLSVFKNFGVSLPHSSVVQATRGTKISLAEAKPGDLVFYGNGKRINHVAIYLGGGMIVHASNPRTGIRTSNVYYRTPVKVVRVLYD